MLRHTIPACVATLLLVTACDRAETDTDTSGTETVAQNDVEGEDYGYETYGDDNLADTMASDDARYNSEAGSEGSSDTDETTPASGSADDADEATDDKDRELMQLQVVLDRRGFGPGVIDGAMGMSTRNALEGFQEANDLQVTGEHDEATKKALAEWDRIPATRMVTIPDSWAEIEYTDMPEDTAEKAELERMGYASIDEKLAERFHTTVAVLRELNPDAGASTAAKKEMVTGRASPSSPTPTASASDKASSDANSYFRPGQKIRVPNIGADRIAPGAVSNRNTQQLMASLGVGTDQPEVDKIVVSKGGDTLKAYQGDKLVALFTVSSGSSEFPLPLGEWDINATAFNPPYRYDPEVLGNSDSDKEVYNLPPGPNSPVGIVWIDLSKEHYGIHGTPEPETIGRAQSSGCVRLTNWDAARLAQMVDTETQVIFEA